MLYKNSGLFADVYKKKKERVSNIQKTAKPFPLDLDTSLLIYK